MLQSGGGVHKRDNSDLPPSEKHDDGYFLCIFGGFAPADSSKDEREDGQGERNWGKKETGMSRQYDAVYRYIKSAFPQRKYM